MRDKWTLLADFNVLVPGLGSLWPSLSCLSDHCLTHVRGEKAAFQSRLFVGKEERNASVHMTFFLFVSRQCSFRNRSLIYLLPTDRPVSPSTFPQIHGLGPERASITPCPWDAHALAQSVRERERLSPLHLPPAVWLQDPIETESLWRRRRFLPSALSFFLARFLLSWSPVIITEGEARTKAGEEWPMMREVMLTLLQVQKAMRYGLRDIECRHFFRMTRDLRLFKADRTRFGNCILAVPAMRMKYW